LEEFDYIVVGAGSAGCVAAGRLVAEQGAHVLLLEEGAHDRSMLIKMPAGAFKIMTGAGGFLKTYRSVPQASLDGRTVDIAQARVPGGGSSVNALVYTRGAREDYDAWDLGLGGAGWGWNDILPHFKRQEGNQRLSNDSHGSAGPLKVSDFRNICQVSKIFIPTMEALGIQRTDDFNAGDERGVGFFQGTLFRSKRFSAANAFLDPVRADKNLSLKTGAAVTRIVIENGCAVGVEFQHAGRSQVARCRREIILTAGAYASPKLLLLSGIGPGAQLARHGIAVRQDLPGVGQNMQDHPIVSKRRESDPL
jgi:choline dehydrogenase